MLMTVSFPPDKFNAVIQNGMAGRKIRSIIDEIKPEAVYFTEHEGKRSAVMVVNVPEPWKIPSYAEPWFLTFDAEVEFRIVMSQEELQKAGLDDLGRKWS
jgi:hypothetical protein